MIFISGFIKVSVSEQIKSRNVCVWHNIIKSYAVDSVSDSCLQIVGYRTEIIIQEVH